MDTHSALDYAFATDVSETPGFEPRTYEEAINSKDKERWILAIDSELHSHQINGTWYQSVGHRRIRWYPPQYTPQPQHYTPQQYQNFQQLGGAYTTYPAYPVQTSMFHDCIYAGTEKKSAEKGVELAKTSVNSAGGKEQFVGCVVDNTSSMVSMQARLEDEFPWMITSSGLNLLFLLSIIKPLNSHIRRPVHFS